VGLRLFGSWAALPPLAVPFAGLLLHGNVLMKKGQLLVELVLGLRELVESCPSLGVGDTVLAPVQSYSMSRPHKHCTPTWGRNAACFVPSESS
jgi:hypothetical protein